MGLCGGHPRLPGARPHRRGHREGSLTCPGAHPGRNRRNPARDRPAADVSAVAGDRRFRLLEARLSEVLGPAPNPEIRPHARGGSPLRAEGPEQARAPPQIQIRPQPPPSLFTPRGGSCPLFGTPPRSPIGSTTSVLYRRVHASSPRRPRFLDLQPMEARHRARPQAAHDPHRRTAHLELGLSHHALHRLDPGRRGPLAGQEESVHRVAGSDHARPRWDSCGSN